MFFHICVHLITWVWCRHANTKQALLSCDITHYQIGSEMRFSVQGVSKLTISIFLPACNSFHNAGNTLSLTRLGCFSARHCNAALHSFLQTEIWMIMIILLQTYKRHLTTNLNKSSRPFRRYSSITMSDINKFFKKLLLWLCVFCFERVKTEPSNSKLYNKRKLIFLV